MKRGAARQRCGTKHAAPGTLSGRLQQPTAMLPVKAATPIFGHCSRERRAQSNQSSRSERCEIQRRSPARSVPDGWWSGKWRKDRDRRRSWSDHLGACLVVWHQPRRHSGRRSTGRAGGVQQSEPVCAMYAGLRHQRGSGLPIRCVHQLDTGLLERHVAGLSDHSGSDL